MTSVSVITPAYKAETFIARAVKSVLAQTHDDWEMVIAADDRQDYKAILQAQGITDPRLRFATTGKTGAGPGAARNVALDNARFDIIANLDADDEYAKDFLSQIVPVAVKNGAATGKMHFIEEDSGKKKTDVTYPAKDGSLSLRQILRYSLSYQDIVFDRRRSRARWPEALRYGEDLVFWATPLDDLPAIHYVAAAEYNYYLRQDSLSHSHPEGDTHILCERIKTAENFLENNSTLIRNADNRDFLKRWFNLRHDLEAFFDFKMVDPGTYITELNRRLDIFFASA